MKQLGVESLSKRRAGQLSGGEAQRVSLATAFVLEPEFLLLDEPFSSLDPPTRAKLLDDLSALLTEDHRTAVFVTHNLNEADEVESAYRCDCGRSAASGGDATADQSQAC